MTTRTGARIVLTSWGSCGDVFPYLGLALALKARGHAPIPATSSYYRRGPAGHTPGDVRGPARRADARPAVGLHGARADVVLLGARSAGLPAEPNTHVTGFVFYNGPARMPAPLAEHGTEQAAETLERAL